MITVAEKIDSRIKDRVGDRYGNLTVLACIGSDKGTSHWRCRCDCGVETDVTGRHLQQGMVKSCGCIRRGRKLPKGEAAFNQLFRGMKYNAVKRKKRFELTKEQVRDLVTQACWYCGSLPTQRFHGLRLNGDFTYNGIDRVNNSIGYVEGNVVPCCGQCNTAKNTLGVKEFKAWIVRAYEYFKDQR